MRVFYQLGNKNTSCRCFPFPPSGHPNNCRTTLLPVHIVCMELMTQPSSAYTVPVQIGTSQQNFSLQVDTGSSDLVRICHPRVSQKGKTTHCRYGITSGSHQNRVPRVRPQTGDCMTLVLPRPLVRGSPFNISRGRLSVPSYGTQSNSGDTSLQTKHLVRTNWFTL